MVGVPEKIGPRKLVCVYTYYVMLRGPARSVIGGARSQENRPKKIGICIYVLCGGFG